MYKMDTEADLFLSENPNTNYSVSRLILYNIQLVFF